MKKQSIRLTLATAGIATLAACGGGGGGGSASAPRAEITGANNSKLRVTAGACPTTAEAQLELMAAGESSYGASRCVPWSQLEG
jgi:hypothetical protein